MIVRRRGRSSARGQALPEFALVVPLFILFLGGIVQLGLLFWAQNTLTQIARDTGRWASTQVGAGACSNQQAVINQANAIAATSSLIGYTNGSWNSQDVSVTWSGTCPPKDNTEVGWVTISIQHNVPVFFPFVPGNGHVTTSAEFRMEPKP